MTYLLQFCGLSDPLQLFYLEQTQGAGPAFCGFRPVQLDGLLSWAQLTARQRHWDLEVIHQAVLEAWMERADLIRRGNAAFNAGDYPQARDLFTKAGYKDGLIRLDDYYMFERRLPLLDARARAVRPREVRRCNCEGNAAQSDLG